MPSSFQKYQILYVLKLKYYSFHPATIVKLLVLLFITELYSRTNVLILYGILKIISEFWFCTNPSRIEKCRTICLLAIVAKLSEINPFLSNDPILYPLKTPESFQGIWNGNIGQKWVKRINEYYPPWNYQN